MGKQTEPRIIFITGTDTGVGKTVLTGLLISHLRRKGHRAIAIKPFCSGGRGDAEILYSLQKGEVTLRQINPFYFHKPLAPLVAARMQKRRISLQTVLGAIELVIDKLRDASGVARARPGSLSVQRPSTSFLLIEGAGGLFAPLGEPSLRDAGAFTALDLIMALRERRNRSRHVHVVVVAANRLGTINHTLLTVGALEHSGIENPAIVLMHLKPAGTGTAGQLLRTNAAIIGEFLAASPVYSLPFLGNGAAVSRAMRAPPARIGTVLDSLLD